MKHYLVTITFASSEEIISLLCTRVNTENRQASGKHSNKIKSSILQNEMARDGIFI